MVKFLDNLIKKLQLLPSIGPKTAQRIAFYILTKLTDAQATELAQAIIEAKQKLKLCKECFNYAEEELCPICADQKREQTLLCVVENPSDVLSIERSGKYRGLYHVLGGALSPINNIGPADLRIKELIERIKKSKYQEIIIATNPTREGEATADYLVKLIKPFGIKITRIARGLPIGSDLDLADSSTISEAIEGRKEIE
ncbi:MAG: recombination mediator RecR [candidate division WOR-3 bacterium]